MVVDTRILTDRPLQLVQANQKDDQIEAFLSGKIVEVVKNIKGQLFANTHSLEISIAVKLIYLCFTTLKGARTLGEEYVDLIYVNRNGTMLVQRYKKLLFIASYCLGPYLISKTLRRYTRGSEDGSPKTAYSVKNILNALVNVHLILFYFTGAYHDISKRLFGLKYALGHKVDDSEAKFRKASSSNYRFLGYILLLQGAGKWIPLMTRQLGSLTRRKESNDSECKEMPTDSDIITNVPSETQIIHVDLSDESQLPYIPKASRTCILCLSVMMDPSCAPCGHIFCWTCILNWTRERPECPLCRQNCKTQQVLLLR
ncbi:hypothetical protein HG536_0A06500 [Torulaspora globosa]|uniref:RING-type E3 ubiquitin transferase n=1 Tax=Torulaspora globosa TaxID=48254 RepID=A0A7G3ZBE9_9SACH|nr:uncharacterized protein HG536_0A06500 [Torulaspora globosa]QLL30835.1 hypothetical protein HG536_0A06500 [Torulaspora globosa]